MIWSPIVTILAVTVLLCGCGSTTSPTTASNMAREPALPEGMEYRSGTPVPGTAPESLPEITVKPELLTDAGILCPMEYGTDADVIFLADLDHDGEPEHITAGPADFQASGGQYVSLKVLAGESADSPVIWEHDYSVAHVGQTMLYLYRENGTDYLMEYSPYINQEYSAYSIRIFYIGLDRKTVEVHSHTADFALQQEDRTGFLEDPDTPAALMDTAGGYIKSSLLLVSTDRGRLAYSTPERPVALDHDDSFFTGSWNITGKQNGRETIECMLQKNRMATEGISLLCISRPSGDTVEVQFRNQNHSYTTSNPVINQLFADMIGRNWTFLPDREPSPGLLNAVLSVYRKEGMDVFISCYQKEETTVIQTAPFVYNIVNDMRSVNECYYMPTSAAERLLSWAPRCRLSFSSVMVTSSRGGGRV